MRLSRKVVAVTLIFSFFAFSTAARAEEDALHRTLLDALYGGVIGALLGGATLALTNHPGDHLGYIPTGAAIGVIAGTVWGVATSAGVVQPVGELHNNRLTFNVPTVNSYTVTDIRTGSSETVESVELFRYKF